MDTYLNDSESRLFDLIESKDWENLTSEEQAFAARHISKEDYVLQRNILLASAELYSDETEPLLLVIPAIQRKPFIQKSIPLYQALVAIAATVFIFLWVRPKDSKPVLSNQPVHIKAAPLEPKVEKAYVFDTVIRYITRTESTKKIIFDTVHTIIKNTKIAEEAPRILEASLNLPVVPELTNEKLVTKGASLKEDNTSTLLPRNPVNTIY